MGAGNPNWHKGMVSPNTKGRPPNGEALASLFRAVGDMFVEGPDGKPSKITLRTKMIENLYKAAAMGDNDSSTVVMNREFGKVMDQIQILGDEQEWDLSGLTKRELEIFAIIMKKIQPKGENGPSDAS
jgi:hypothetical protein